MKLATTLFTIAAFILLTLSAKAQEPKLAWAKAMGGSEDNHGNSITTDELGNVYTTGRFEKTVDFDPGPTTNTYTSNGSSDVYIQKLDKNGDLIWARQLGGTLFDEGIAIKTDTDGNVYTVGSFRGTVDFDPGVGTNNLTAISLTDIFIQKLDSNGNLVWVNTIGGKGSFSIYDIELDKYGNLYTSINLSDTATFHSVNGDTTLTTKGGAIFKLNSSGDFIWSKHFFAQTLSLKVDKNLNIYSVGFFSDTVDFDPGAGIANLISSFRSIDIFIQKLDSLGDFIWAKKMGGRYTDEGLTICLDKSGNIFTSGYFKGTVDFNPGSGIASLTSNGNEDIFIQKLNNSGDFLWVKQIGGTSFDHGLSIDIDTLGNLYTTGFFINTVDFDPSASTFYLSTPAFTSNIFIQKLNNDGNFKWAVKMGGATQTDGGRGFSLTTDNDGNLYTTGFFYGLVDFDPRSGTNNLNTSGANYDIFVQKLNQCFPSYSVDTQVTCGSYTWIDNNTYNTSNQSATFTLTNAEGCDSIITLNLTINEVYDLSTSVNDFIITANNLNADSFQWLDCDSSWSIIPGDTNRTFSPTKNGNYAVQLTENGCIDTSACVEITALSLIENSFKENIEVFPNPTHENFAIKFENLQNTIFVRLSTMSGKLIVAKKFKNVVDIPMELNDAKGVYILEIQDQSGKKAIIKLIKK